MLCLTRLPDFDILTFKSRTSLKGRSIDLKFHFQACPIKNSERELRGATLVRGWVISFGQKVVLAPSTARKLVPPPPDKGRVGSFGQKVALAPYTAW